jgi:hypothetical protein
LQKGGIVGLFLRSSLLLLLSAVCTAAPIIQKIVNDTDFGFLILDHSDTSECSLKNKFMVIQPRTIFNYEFLLETGTKGLVLRPVFYKNQKDNKISWLTDQNLYEYNDGLIEEAYKNWSFGKSIRKHKRDPETWMRNWLGGDISVTYDPLELLGYLLSLSRVRISNTNSYHTQWLSFSKGIFSKLMLELRLSQKTSKGIAGVVSVEHGEGGICNEGVVERI